MFDTLYLIDNEDISFVKQAHDSGLLDTSEITTVATELTKFAVHFNGNNYYPCSTVNDATLNALLLIKDCESLPEDVVKIAAYHLSKNITNELLKAELLKIADENIYMSNVVDLPDFVYEVPVDASTLEFIFPEEQLLPITDEEQLSKTAQVFKESYHEFDSEQRSYIAERILDKAAELNVSLEPDVNLLFHSGGYQFHDNIQDRLLVRAQFIEDPDLKTNFIKVANEFDHLLNENPDEVINELLKLEKEAGLDLLYDFKLNMPLEDYITYKEEPLHEKIAALDPVVMLDLLTEETYKFLLDPETAEEAFSYLPNPVQENIRALI